MDEVNVPETQPQTETESGEFADNHTEETVFSDDDVLIAEAVTDEPRAEEGSAALKAIVEAAIYITDEPLTAEQIAVAIEQPLPRIKEILNQLVAEYGAPDRGLSVRELAGGYKMSTKPEFHEPVRRFVKNLQPPLKLSLPALETLAVVAYKQPITGPEILEIRGVQGAGVLKTLLDRKLIATAGRKNVLGKPMMYKTTRDFLVQFGLNSVAELPTLKEFEELGRMALADEAADADVVEGVVERMGSPLQISLPTARLDVIDEDATDDIETEPVDAPSDAETAQSTPPPEKNEDHG